MKQARILVVDDEPGIRSSLSGVLEDEGYEVDTVADGEQCLDRVAAQNYDVVLLDVWLPGIDGMATLARIQEIPFAERPMVVMISGHGNIETAVKATKLGAFDFLEKPLTIEKVTVLVKNAIQQRRSPERPDSGDSGVEFVHIRRKRNNQFCPVAELNQKELIFFVGSLEE